MVFDLGLISMDWAFFIIDLGSSETEARFGMVARIIRALGFRLEDSEYEAWVQTVQHSCIQLRGAAF